MKLYSSGEIVNKLKKATSRQILDLAEKGLIIPFRETTGAGSPRLYDFQNIFDICICLTLRGVFNGEPLKKILKLCNKPTTSGMVKIPLAGFAIIVIDCLGLRSNLSKIFTQKEDLR